MAKPTLLFDLVPRGSVLADVTVRSGPWVLQGFKVMQPSAKSKSNTIWVSWPSVKIGRWRQLVDVPDDNRKAKLEALIISEYLEVAAKPVAEPTSAF